MRRLPEKARRLLRNAPVVVLFEELFPPLVRRSLQRIAAIREERQKSLWSLSETAALRRRVQSMRNSAQLRHWLYHRASIRQATLLWTKSLSLIDGLLSSPDEQLYEAIIRDIERGGSTHLALARAALEWVEDLPER